MRDPVSPGPDHDFEVFYDGDCPLCRREIAFLARLDRRGRARFTDIAAPAFDARALGVPLPTLMRRIHGRTPSGDLVTGVEVFRRLYAAVGLGPLVALSRLRPIATVLDLAYEHFARNRLRWTGRCTDATCAA